MGGLHIVHNMHNMHNMHNIKSTWPRNFQGATAPRVAAPELWERHRRKPFDPGLRPPWGGLGPNTPPDIWPPWALVTEVNPHDPVVTRAQGQTF